MPPPRMDIRMIKDVLRLKLHGKLSHEAVARSLSISKGAVARYMSPVMPVYWTGTLEQYAGRLHGEHAGKTDVRIIAFLDAGHPALLRMWDKRQRGYRAMGHRIASDVLAER